ncbi:hypothetical protein E3N88_00278 [Mikania micrantha]|uniref:Uncharacterized protein n=1 Tax=Mikania micrantha TaxID=192012 RepID=A0A5N6PY02_9ASTR|nr:hypothetical protein E3N88_00278 [Mikania micrantha]
MKQSSSPTPAPASFSGEFPTPQPPQILPFVLFASVSHTSNTQPGVFSSCSIVRKQARKEQQLRRSATPAITTFSDDSSAIRTPCSSTVTWKGVHTPGVCSVEMNEKHEPVTAPVDTPVTIFFLVYSSFAPTGMMTWWFSILNRMVRKRLDNPEL